MSLNPGDLSPKENPNPDHAQLPSSEPLSPSKLAKGILTKSELGYGDYLRFRQLVQERSGLDFPEKKWSSLSLGIFKALGESPLAFAGDTSNLDEYYNLLRDKHNPLGRAEMERLIRMLTIGETHFFRDKAQFEALRQHVLPQLIARKRAAAAAIAPGIQPQLRIWSAGCATGEEPYSVAIMLKELLPDLENWHILILATDINEEALTRAQDGLYYDWSFREVQAKTFRSLYFQLETPTRSHQLRTGYRLNQDIRQMVTFAPLNLSEDDYPAIHNNTVAMDLVLCRNVTIYFTPEATQQVVNRFYETLVEGGWLIVGHSEPSLVMYNSFQLHQYPDAFLYQKISRPTSRQKEWPHPETGRAIATAPLDPMTLPAIALRPALPAPTLAEEPLVATKLAGTNNEAYLKAQRHLRTGRVQEAIIELQQQLTQRPDFAPAHSLLGLAYANLEQWTEAKQCCHSALALDNLLAEAYFVLGLVAQQEADQAVAITMFKKAIYLDRRAPLFHFHLAVLYRRQGQLEAAQRTYQNGVRILKKWPPDQVVPYSDGTTARYLLAAMQRVFEG